jgi:hypothetical protein
MMKTTLYLDPEVAVALRQLAIGQGRSQSELIRAVLADYARQAKRPLPKGVGAYRSGRPDIGQRARRLVRAAVRERRWP